MRPMKRLHLFFLFSALFMTMSGCQPEPYLDVNPKSLSFTRDGGSQSVSLTANSPWSATVSGSGFSVSPTSGEGDASVTITAQPASSAEDVTSSVTFSSEGLKVTVTLKQESKSSIVVGTAAKVPAEGGIFTVDIQYNTDYDIEIESSAQN